MPGTLHGRIARALARRAGVRIFRLFGRALRAAGPVPAREGLHLRVLEMPAVNALAADPELDLAAERVNEAYARGDACAAAFKGGELAGYCWFAFSPLPHLDGVWVDFAPDVVWIYKSFVRPAHRGKGVAPALYGFADILGPGRGRGSALICVETHNGASIAAARRSGHASAGSAAYRVRQGSVSAWYSPEARRRALRFYLPGGAGVEAPLEKRREHRLGCRGACP